MAQGVGSIAAPISDVTSKLRIELTGVSGFARRLKIAGWLFRLGARIAPIDVELTNDEQSLDKALARAGYQFVSASRPANPDDNKPADGWRRCRADSEIIIRARRLADG